MITQEIIDKLNIIIENAIDHGGDSGGAYYMCADCLYDSIVNLLEILDPEHKTEVVWQHYLTKEFMKNDEIKPDDRQYPTIRFKES